MANEIRRVRTTRPVYLTIRGENRVVGVGSVIDLGKDDAAMLLGSNKGVIDRDAEPQIVEPTVPDYAKLAAPAPGEAIGAAMASLDRAAKALEAAAAALTIKASGKKEG